MLIVYIFQITERLIRHDEHKEYKHKAVTVVKASLAFESRANNIDGVNVEANKEETENNSTHHSLLPSYARGYEIDGNQNNGDNTAVDKRKSFWTDGVI